MTLDEPGDGIEVFGAGMAAEPRPSGLRLARCFHRSIDIPRTGLRHPGQHLARRRVRRVEPRTAFRLPPASVDEKLGVGVLLDPGARFLVALRRRTVVHRVEDFGYGHV